MVHFDDLARQSPTKVVYMWLPRFSPFELSKHRDYNTTGEDTYRLLFDHSSLYYRNTIILTVEYSRPILKMHLVPRTPFEDQYAVSYGFSIAPLRNAVPKSIRERFVRLPGHLGAPSPAARSSSRPRIPSTASTAATEPTSATPTPTPTLATPPMAPSPSTTMMAASKLEKSECETTKDEGRGGKENLGAMNMAKHLGREWENRRATDVEQEHRVEEKEKEQIDKVLWEIDSEKTQVAVKSSEVSGWMEHGRTYRGESSRDAELGKERSRKLMNGMYTKGKATVKEEEVDILEWRFQRGKMEAEEKERRKLELHRLQVERMEEIEREQREIQRDRAAALRTARDGKKREEGTGRCLVLDELVFETESKEVDGAVELGKGRDGKKEEEPCACHPPQAAMSSQVEVREVTMGYQDGTIKDETSAHEANRLREEKRLKRAKRLRQQAYWARRQHEDEMMLFLSQQEEVMRNGSLKDEEDLRIWWEDIMQELKKVEYAEALAENGGLLSQDLSTVRSKK